MKTITKFMFMALILLSEAMHGQGINYKAMVKDGNGAVLANQNVTVQFSILLGLAKDLVYSETHSTTTDVNGLIILNIGEGTSIAGVFQLIDYSRDDHFLKTEVNTGSGLVDMGTTEFKNVPYALLAKSVDGLKIEDNGAITAPDLTQITNVV